MVVRGIKMFAFKSKKSKKEKQEELKKKKGYNPYLVARVQPQGESALKKAMCKQVMDLLLVFMFLTFQQR